jgi:peptidoglycan/LPS O-acetylase OafA/YrhL
VEEARQQLCAHPAELRGGQVSVKSAKNLDIEHLRAMAISMVLIAHVILLSPFIWEKVVPLFRYASMGVGVDLFFCISGYVVSRSYFAYFQRHSARGDFWTAARMFWLRRGYRLLPSAWLWVLVGLFCALCFNSTGIFMTVEQNLKSALAVFSFTANIALVSGELAPNNVYWSLALEEQFYFLFPLFLLLVRSDRGRVIALLLIIAVQFPLARNHFGDLNSQYLASFRTDGFAWGILIFIFSQSALYRRIEPRVFGRYKSLSLLVTLLLLYLLAAVPALLYSLPINMGLMAMVAASLVWLASYGKGYIFGYRGLGGFMSWLGARSYGIYLIHMPVFRITHEVAVRYLQTVGQPYGPTAIPFLLLGAGMLILLLAELNYRFIEEPLRRRGSEYSRRKLALDVPVVV